MPAPALFKAVAEQAEDLAAKGSPQELANTVWAYAVANQLSALPSQLLARIVELWEDDLARADYTDDGLVAMIFQADLAARDCGIEWGLPASLLQRGQQKWQFQLSNGRASWFESEVAKVLSTMGWRYEQEYVTECGNFSIDIVLEGRRVAIEANGPFHYVGKLEDGATQLRRRMLEARGWEVVSVPYFEWGPLGSSTEKQQYLEQKLGRLPRPPPKAT